ncbi:MAG UNVERIFIED_CONTAM: hypothetical protein LVQ98_05980 [Rickettsiaceae bacterium]
MNSVFMIASTLLLSFLYYIDCSVQFVILVLSVLNIMVALYIYHLVPETRVIPEPIVRLILKFLFDKLYG